MGVELDRQTALLARLDATAALTDQLAVHAYTPGKKALYDHVPQADDAGNAVPFPYVAIGDETDVPWDTDDSVGREATITIHTLSRYKGKKQAQNIMGAIKAALHQHALAVAGQVTVLCYWEYAEIFTEPDGVTRHGVQRFRIITEGA
jgi:hypothetical protein